ncbi:TPA: RNA-binding domain-containing protein [Listeria monocytogenes]|nr:AAA family ATPase [Listeria monocytogenes]EAC2676660.1 AAA family ATPase [Listeria monocytogenes]EAC8669807.1 AAA family ATPase [Listeria monocytogenes]EAC8916710.1 AAA family ATPase [Listeria monocytogenes]EAC9092852.1 AAA family ATPase [Listeria monocytogenes]
MTDINNLGDYVRNMIREEAQKRLHDGEGLTVEYKKSQSSISKDVYETVVSFSNRNGGFIYLGVQDDGTVIGVEPDKIGTMKNDFVTSVNNMNKINPPLYLELEELTVQDRTVLFVYVPVSSQVHRLNQNKIMDRNAADGDIDITSNTHAVRDMYTRKDNTFTENQIFPYLELTDFRKDLIDRVRKGAANVRPDHPFTELNDSEMMRSLGMYRKDIVTRDEGFTLAAVLCFGKDETIASLINYWRVDILERIDDEERFDSRLNIQTNLIDTYYEVMEFLQKQKSLPEKFIIEGTERVNARNILFRELIVNMLVHRELSNAFVSTVSIYSDKIEVINANKPINPGIITSPVISPYPKNPTIAKVFNYLGIIDELGSGIGKIFKYSKLYFDYEPVLENEGLFKVIMKREPFILPNISKALDDSLMSREVRIFEYIQSNGKITNKSVRDLLGVKETAARNLLNKMVASGSLEWVGKNKNDPGQHYILRVRSFVPRSDQGVTKE